ncbi:hypothetical protein [Vibrio sp. 99-70-13A1]|uniref:COG3650 family protein n=1 Tax=Vibrio sp. 99-70-13A1 TaxID=2607601 RepID=UPI001493DA28|nr:hypothetical protein [Vibrio sp. 99-70-13A1]NOH96481.1 hypothetical protein [Vibrio sp. 99-70-13A1]
MKAFKNPATWLAILALQGCSTAPEVMTEPELPPATLDEPKSIQPQTFIMRGQVVVGHETRTFTPCGSKQQYWLDLPKESLQQALILPSRPYQTMYGEMIGHLSVPSQTGYNADFTARFVVEQVNLLTTENPERCSQPLRSTRAFGTEPFWSASFNKDQITYTPMGDKPQNLAIQSSRVSSDKRKYSLNDGSLELQKGTCNDGMSDSIYGWKSQLAIGSKDLEGCATVANVDSTLDWSGLYFASSTDNVGFSVQLELHDNHSATTTYSYTSGEPSIVEQGFWQQLNKDQVQVVMTQHQQQYLISERIFTRNGYQITAEKEKVGNVVYPISNGGLTLFRAKPTLNTQVEKAPSTSVDLSAKQINSSSEFNQDVDNAIRHYFKIHQTSPDNTKYRWLTYDLNGDGNDELLAQLDWCGSGGCTLLIFENYNDDWRFNSRITLVQDDIRLGKAQHHGWQDLIFNVRGGGATPAQHKLSYTGVSYPMNPSVAPVAQNNDVTDAILFADKITPAQDGVML